MTILSEIDHLRWRSFADLKLKEKWRPGFDQNKDEVIAGTNGRYWLASNNSGTKQFLRSDFPRMTPSDWQPFLPDRLADSTLRM